MCTQCFECTLYRYALVEIEKEILARSKLVTLLFYTFNQLDLGNYHTLFAHPGRASHLSGSPAVHVKAKKQAPKEHYQENPLTADSFSFAFYALHCDPINSLMPQSSSSSGANGSQSTGLTDPV